MRRMVVAGIVLVCAAFIAGGGVEGQRIAPEPNAPIRTPTQVEVSNFPAVQAVSGSVQVNNLPLDGDGNVKASGALSATPALIRVVGFSEQTFLIPQTCCEHLQQQAQED